MPRELTKHKVNECNDKLKIEVLGEPGQGAACHVYHMGWPSKELAVGYDETTIHFQNGPIKEVGTNGITHEALLAILIDRMEHFQAGDFACEENHQALDCMKEALYQLKKRTGRRVEAGTEGTNVGV